MHGLELIYPDWPAPTRVAAVSTTRIGGVSAAPFDGLNLGSRVGDTEQAVAENRRRLSAALALPEPPRWPRQVHGVTVVAAECLEDGETPADAVWSHRAGEVCAVQTADCLPVLLCDRDGERVAVAHAGWRGLGAGVLEQTVAALQIPGDRLLAWLGPAIGPAAFEVGGEVRAAFLDADPGAGEAFQPSPAGRWLADLYRLARRQLHGAGVTSVFGGGFCTFNDPQRFYSYRRAQQTGRMATLIWRTR